LLSIVEQRVPKIPNSFGSAGRIEWRLVMIIVIVVVAIVVAAPPRTLTRGTPPLGTRIVGWHGERAPCGDRHRIRLRTRGCWRRVRGRREGLRLLRRNPGRQVVGTNERPGPEAVGPEVGIEAGLAALGINGTGGELERGHV
jgi:hypothetical protein